jgi:hypothetical protein
MKTCGVCPRRPAGAALRASLRKRARVGLLRWKAPRAREDRRIDMPRSERAHATGLRAALRSVLAAAKRCQRVPIDGAAVPPKKRRRPSPNLARKCEGGCSIDPKPAACCQARSCWRPDDRKVVRRRTRTKRRKRRRPSPVSKSNVGGFPTALGGRSPEVMFVAGARDAKRRL